MFWTGYIMGSNTGQLALSGQENSAEANSRYWLSYEGLNSEHYFRQRVDALTDSIWDAYNRGHLARIESDMRRLAWVEPLVQDEPLLSFYESALVNSSLATAYWASGVFELDRGFRVA